MILVSPLQGPGRADKIPNTSISNEIVKYFGFVFMTTVLPCQQWVCDGETHGLEVRSCQTQ